MNNYIPPFTITNIMLDRISSIMKKIGKLENYKDLNKMPVLRRNNRIKSIHSSLAIEANSLSFDQVKYQRQILSKMKVEHRTYLMLYQDSSLGPAHAFLLFKDSNKKYYWYENVWYKYRGIHEYNSKKEAFSDIRSKFSETIKDFHDNKLRIYQFEKPRSGVNYIKYLSNAMNGRIVRIEK